MKQPASSRRYFRYLVSATIILAALAAFVVWYFCRGRPVIAAAQRYLRARPLSQLAVETTGQSVQLFAVAPHPASDPYEVTFQQTALVGRDRFWVPVEIVNGSAKTMYLRMRAAAGGPQLLLPAVEYRLGAGRRETILLPLSREGVGKNRRVVINATLDIGKEHYRTQLVLFDITPVVSAFSGREPGHLTLME